MQFKKGGLILTIQQAVEMLADVYKKNARTKSVKRPVTKSFYEVWRAVDLDPNVERCVCCGEVIPEGGQVCARCREKW